MARLVGALLIAGSLGAAAPLSAQHWEFKMISSGPNRPSLPLGRPPWRDGLIALREGRGDVPDSVIAALRHEGVLADGRPTCLVVSRTDGEALQHHAEATARAFLPRMLPQLDAIQGRLTQLAELRETPWPDLALLVYSNVLLDNWQINGVERDWLGADRPQRAGGRYYCALFESDGEAGEAFGIWGNQIRGGARWWIGVYGRNRNAPGLHNRSATAAALALGLDTASIPRDARLDAVADRLSEAVPMTPTPPAVRALATQDGFWQDDRITLVRLTSAADSAFEQAADHFRPALVAFLRDHNDALDALRTALRYESVPSAEFRIWWYHFFYSAVTRELVRAGRIPEGRADRVTYLMARPDRP